MDQESLVIDMEMLRNINKFMCSAFRPEIIRPFSTSVEHFRMRIYIIVYFLFKIVYNYVIFLKTINTSSVETNIRQLKSSTVNLYGNHLTGEEHVGVGSLQFLVAGSNTEISIDLVPSPTLSVLIRIRFSDNSCSVDT